MQKLQIVVGASLYLHCQKPETYALSDSMSFLPVRDVCKAFIMIKMELTVLFAKVCSTESLLCRKQQILAHTGRNQNSNTFDFVTHPNTVVGMY